MAVNQIWMHHFDTPLVPSVFDFGRNGKPPAIPALLDWLAVQLRTEGWRMKPIHRLIVTSAAYRMESTSGGPDDPNLARDPANIYYWRMNPKRMEAEAVRDNVLHVAGNLDQSPGRARPRPGDGSEIAAPQLVLPPRQGKARDVPSAVRFAQRALVLPANRERDAPAGAGTGQ